MLVLLYSTGSYEIKMVALKKQQEAEKSYFICSKFISLLVFLIYNFTIYLDIENI
jgi:hypothetical protein